MTEQPITQETQIGFLDLPPELRCLIYKQLVPRATYIPAEPYKSIRDVDMTTPGILTANRLISGEVLKEWHSMMQHELKLSNTEMVLAGTRVGLHSPELNDRIGRIRNMRLAIEIVVGKDNGPVMSNLVMHLLSIPKLLLRHVNLVVAVRPKPRWDSPAQWSWAPPIQDGDVLKTLQQSFDAAFHGLKEKVTFRSWTLDTSNAADFCGFDGREMYTVIEDVPRFERIAIPYFRQLAKEWNPHKTDFKYMGRIGKVKAGG